MRLSIIQNILRGAPRKMVPSRANIMVRKAKNLVRHKAKQLKKNLQGSISGAAERDHRLYDLSVGHVGFYSGCLSDIARRRMREMELDD